MTSIEYKSGMIHALDDLAGDLEEEFWLNDAYHGIDGIPRREAMLLYIKTSNAITNRILALQKEVDQELDEMSKQA